MFVSELKAAIQGKKAVPHVVILTGSQYGILTMYGSRLLQSFGAEANISHFDSVSAAYGTAIRKNNKNAVRVFLVRNDDEFLKAADVWEKVFRLFRESKNDYLILIYGVLDKRGKFYKTYYKDEIIEFNSIDREILVKHFKEIGLSQQDLNDLIDWCEEDYGRLVLAIDNIKTLAKARGVSHYDAYRMIVCSGTFSQTIKDFSFRFVDSILRRDKEKVGEYLQYWEEQFKNENVLPLLGLLYSRFKGALLVQGLGNDKKNMSQRTGLTPFQCKLAVEDSDYYGIDEILQALDKIREYEEGIKTGEQDSVTAVTRLILNVI